MNSLQLRLVLGLCACTAFADDNLSLQNISVGNGDVLSHEANITIQTASAVTVQSGGQLNLTAGSRVTIGAGFHAQVGSRAIFRAGLAYLVDTDGDGMRDGWEQQYGFNLNSNADAFLDADGDGLSNLSEYLLGRNPRIYESGTSTMGATVPAGWPLLTASSARNEAVGMTSGQFAVDKSGAATYSIPIAVSPGTAGMQPHLSLNYSSQGGGGVAGFGWSLSGLSMVSRAPATRVQDGFIHGVSFDANDRYSLDGQRLIAISGSDGSSGTEYRTEIDSFTRIVSYSTRGSSGPAMFKAWTKAGLIIEFGGTEDSTIVPTGGTGEALSWCINKISDTSGNYMTFTYTQDESRNVGRYISRIDYTHNAASGGTPYASVRFEYENRPDIFLGYVHGRQVGDTKRLKTVRAYYGETVVRTYSLHYTQRNRTNRSILAAISETGADGKTYPPLTFDYSNPSEGWDYLPDAWAPPAAMGGWVNNQLLPASAGFIDLNGDGRVDFVSGTSNLNRQAWLNTPTGWRSASGANGDPDWRPPVVGSSARYTDLNNDGHGDAVDASGPAYLGQGNGTWTSSQRWAIPENTPGIENEYNYFESYTRNGMVFVDLNGDGFQDLVGWGDVRYYEYNYSTDERELRFSNAYEVWLNRGNGTDNSSSAGWLYSAAYLVPFGNSARTRFVDLNGDGLVDYLSSWYGSGTGYSFARINTGLGWRNAPEYVTPLLFSASNPFAGQEAPVGTELVDVNGDGLVDVIGRNDAGAIAMNGVYFNTGVGWTPAPAGFFSPVALYHNHETRGGAFLDVNNDGAVDLVRGHGGSRGAWLGTGTGWAAEGPVEQNVIRQFYEPNRGPTGTDFVDVNADGAVDQVWNWLEGSTTMRAAVANRRVNPDRLTKVTSGMGVAVSITYAPLTERNPATGEPTVYQKGSGASYPVFDVAGPMHVVKAVNNDDGAGGQYRLEYNYASYRTHADRGGLGFGLMSVYDTRTQIATTTYFSQEYPFAGSPIKTETVYEDGSANGVKLSESTVTYAQKLLNNGKTRFIFASSSQEKAYNFDTSAADDILTESATITDRGLGNDYDAYGNSLYFSVTTSGAAGAQPHTKVTTSAYDNIIDAPSQSGTSRWYLGRLTASAVTATGAGDTQTRNSSFTYYNTTTGLLHTETIEPGNAALSLTTTYGYDSFGNKNTVVTSGTGVTNRSATTNYDTQGRFPDHTLNGLGHEETYVYDPALGVLTSTTGPNGLTTSWEYDGFARKTKETRADGTVSLMHYRWTAAPTSTNGIPTGAVYHIETESSGAPPALAFYDAFGRTIATRGINGGGLDGLARIVGAETYFDSMGRAYRSSLLHYANVSASEISYTETSNYDALGRAQTLATPTDSGGIAYSFIAFNGFTTETTNPKGQVERVVKNAQGQVVERINNVTAAVNSVERGRVTFTYDAYGQLLTTTVHKDANTSVTTTLEYDARGRKKKMIDPDMGTWEYGYNVFGELIWQKDAEAQYTTMTYDVLGRLNQRKEYTSESAIDPVITTWTYDSASGASLGKLHTVITTGASWNKSVGNNETYTYDSLGRPINVTRLINNKSFTSAQTYDSLGRLQYTIYPSGFQTKNVYNALGFLREVRRSDNGSNELYWAADSYAVDGRVNGEYYGNGLSTDRVYNQRTGRLEMVQSGVGADARAQYLSYTYDVLGNVLTRADTPLRRSETFAYDGLNRLTAHSASAGGPTPSSTTVTVAYDSLGNITQKSDVGSYTYGGPRPHAVTATNGGQTPSSAYEYDSNGNMMNGGGRTYSWTLDNKPWRIEQGSIWSEFTFDSSRQRTTQKTNLGTTTYYVGGAYEEIRSGSNDTTLVERKHYIMAPTGRVAMRVEKNSGSIVETRWFHQDGLGSINAISKENGEIVQRFAYDAWGKRVNGATGASVTSSNNQGFTRGYTDHEHLEDLGLIHMNGRLYDPILARFLSSDPFVDDVGDAQSYNRYSYVSNNPLLYTDPSGFIKWGRVALFGGLSDKEFRQKYGQYGAMAAGYVVAYWVGVWAGPQAGAAAGGFVAGFAGSLLNGANVADAFKTGVICAATAAVTYEIGSYWNSKYVNGARIGSDVGIEAGRALSHGVVQGIATEAQGGDFRHGFYAAAVSSAASSAAAPYLPAGTEFEDRAVRTAFAAVVGGTASVVGGGKFANGAVTAAFVHMYNHESSFWSEINPFNSEGSFAKQSVSVSDSMGGMLGVVWGKITGNSNLQDAGWNQIGAAYDDSALGQTADGPAWAKYGTRGALTVAAAGTVVVAGVGAGEVLASKGYYVLSNHVARQVGANGSRYWSETIVRQTFAGGRGMINSGVGWKNAMTTVRYQMGHGEVVRNFFTNKIVHYLPY